MAYTRSDAVLTSIAAAGVGAVVLAASPACNTQSFAVSPDSVTSSATGQALRGSTGAAASHSQQKPYASSSRKVAVASGAAAISAASLCAKTRRRRGGNRSVLGAAADGKTERSLALPFAPVAAKLTNDPLNPVLPGDLGFDPLGMAVWEGDYVDEVLKNFDVEFDRMRWYREAELMHGRVAMLATLNLLLRESFLSPALPDQLLEQGAINQFVSTMAVIEAYRGWRLFFNTDKIAGDLGLSAWQGPTEEELAERQYTELQNSRLAMLAVAGMAAQYQATGRAVGIDAEQVQKFGEYIVGLANLPEDSWAVTLAAPLLIATLTLDGIRRLSTSDAKQEDNTIKQKSLDVTKLKFGVQDPNLSLPAGVTAGQAPQTLSLTEEQVREFEENGVIMIRGAMKDWVPFLQQTTEHQIENPHFWSLVGRMSGLYDYIQRNTWMTNNGFRDFLYYSPLGHCLAQLGRTEEIRVSTDMLLVNPNKGFGWHQDNQNGPIDFPDAIRWWVAMDPCGQDGFGAPEYVLGSHRNQTVSDEAVFVEREAGDLGSYKKTSTFVAEPGDLIIWDARCIHRIVAPPGQFWEEGTSRRAIGGTVAKAGTRYINKGGASGISDLAGHEQENGELLGGAYFPRIWPNRVPEEETFRAEGRIVGRSPQKMVELASTLASNAGKYVSFTKVVGKKN
mmetsp:Transcript_12268/g.28651  ORF Transcript_12268/g.28651 Transcript_12268/m.28651 type:complete len:676 (-) Transcript_12268:195-2222(-)|eukprot:CAMPEP_0178435676 /NCGR_PEP_ID=MMETSP0689_2-20121128/34051_1 /TAXON_ID=160604 /ORGANISM="Amphidinium massartii, Strain CS-259" /LENGTH=675 /DNA_ID=CAMNT_0020057757 /DNA_START=26 /DNA_END=2053 /DNA_ORIENTATION=-